MKSVIIITLLIQNNCACKKIEESERVIEKTDNDVSDIGLTHFSSKF